MEKDIFKEIEEILPKQTITLWDKNLGQLGFLSIDSLVNGRCCGGIRMYEDISLEETNALARSMTLKFGFLGLPKGGAKAGIIDRGEKKRSLREERIRLFAKGLDYFINKGIYLPGTDLGTSEADLRLIYNTLGIPYNPNGDTTAMYTSFTLICAITTVLKEFLKDITNCTFTIQGFGGIGREIAKRLDERKVRIVSISNIYGALFDKNGLDIKYLLDQYHKYGDEFITRQKQSLKIERDLLLELDADVFLPCAGSWTINLNNVERIKAKFIFPGANIPITDKALECLEAKGIIVAPDFICNSGGVLGSTLRYLGFNSKEMNILHLRRTKRH